MYLKKITIFSIIISSIVSLLYYFKYIINVRSILSDIVSFTGALFGFFIVIFTLLLGNNYKKLYRLASKELEKDVKKIIFVQLKQLLLSCLLLFVYIFLVKVFDLSIFSRGWRIIGIFFLSVLFCFVWIGAFLVIIDMLDFFGSDLEKREDKKKE